MLYIIILCPDVADCIIIPVKVPVWILSAVNNPVTIFPPLITVVLICDVPTADNVANAPWPAIAAAVCADVWSAFGSVAFAAVKEVGIVPPPAIIWFA